MVPADPQFARSEALKIFNHAEVYLLLGAVITTIGLLAGAFSLLRRRLDPLLLWFALFAMLYGLRLALDNQPLWAMHLQPVMLRRVVVALQWLIPIPAIFFFRKLDLFEVQGRALSRLVWRITLCASLVALFFATRHTFQAFNHVLLLTALLAVILLLLRMRAGSPDLLLMRRGLLAFLACILVDNLSGFVGLSYKIEPFGFLVLLATLGVVAGRRAFKSEQQFNLLQRELEIAQQIQLSILPASFPDVKNFRVASRYLPMTAVAGDFYDFLLANDTEVGILIADVSGHGVPAALIASMVKLAAAGQRMNAHRPSDLLLGINETLLGNTQKQFVTAAYVYLNAATQEFRYSAAGHPPMLLLRNGEVTEITENGVPISVFNLAAYATLTAPINPGDRLILYTDGVLEASNGQQEEFGADRLHALVRESATRSPAEAANEIISAIQGWSAAQGDDLTVIVCDYAA